MPPSPRKARNTSNISAGWIAERFQARAKAATESDIAPVPGGSQPSERTLFILIGCKAWSCAAASMRCNKGEARNALAGGLLLPIG
jgi:hypothetical protein